MNKKEQKRQQSRKKLKLLKERLEVEEGNKHAKLEGNPKAKSCFAFIYKLFGKTN